VPLSTAQAHIFEKRGMPGTAQKGQILFSPEGPCLKLWYLKTGIIRAYRIVGNKDITFFFFFEGEFAVDYESFLTEEKSPLYFEALTDCQLLVFAKRTLTELYEQDPTYYQLGKLMAEKAYVSATDRLKQFQADPLQVRYEKLQTKAPHLFEQIPQYYIASYLGVEPQSLSRLRANMLKKGH